MFNPNENTLTQREHAQQRLGLLTSSQAKVIMHGSTRAWKSLSNKMWTETAEDFTRPLTAATEYGHAHEAEGAAKFWETHKWVNAMLEDQFFTMAASPATLGSSPDRVLTSHATDCKYGLEIKSPTGEKSFDAHSLKAHWDQCQHGLLVTGFDAWFLFVHLGDRTQEWGFIKPDMAWAKEYTKRAAAFWRYHMTGNLP